MSVELSEYLAVMEKIPDRDAAYNHTLVVSVHGFVFLPSRVCAIESSYYGDA